MTPTVLWFRQDLRLEDNPALRAARERGGPIIPIYILDDAGEGKWPLGGASRWWLHHALASLDEALRALGSRLWVFRGDTGEVLREIVADTKARALYWNRRYEPAAIARDTGLKAEFAGAGLDVKSFNSALLFEPQTIANKEGKPFQVFTPYWRHCLALKVAEPVKSAAGAIPSPKSVAGAVPLAALELLPTLPWASQFPDHWSPGEAGAKTRLKRFLARSVVDYPDQRNRPHCDGTSQLSPWLHFGEIGPRQVWAAVAAQGKSAGLFPASNGARVFLSEIGWREFAYHLLYHFPKTPLQPLREAYAAFPWASDPRGRKLQAWQRGATGYPIVDAGLRQLWATGWMHNRVRMIVASFLVKHLRLSWVKGAEWFWDTLVDADLASNTLGWQWSAGCGADAAPYFRIFAPVLQGQKFDGDGAYVRRWVPELARLDAKWIHAPWEAPPEALAAAGVELGNTYPRPLVDHATARAEALAAFKSLRGGPS